MSRLARGYVVLYIVLLAVLLVVSRPILLPGLSFGLSHTERAYLEQIESIKAVGDNQFPPFSYNLNGINAGYEADLVAELQKVLGKPVVLEQLTWGEVRGRLDSGQAELVTGMRITAERLQLYSFTRPYLTTAHAVVVPQGNSIKSLNDLRGSHFVAQAGSATYEGLIRDGHRVTAVADPKGAYAALLAGLADAWVEHEWVARYYIGATEFHRWSIQPLSESRGDYAIAVAQTADPRLVRILDKALIRLRHEGTLAELDARWFGPALQPISNIGAVQVRVMILVLIIASLGLGLVLNNTYLQYRVRKQTLDLFTANTLLSKQQEKLRQMLLSAAQAFGVAIEVKDIYTGGHSQRVARVAYDIAVELGLDEKECFTLYLGALMHDIGKVGVPDYILAKTDRLTPEEFMYMRNHPQIGDNILRKVEGYDEVREIVLYHHERWDGTVDNRYPAYPGSKSGADIPLGARIVSVADAFDAMTSDRPYRKARSVDDALEALREAAGTQFDMNIVAAAVRAMDARRPKDAGLSPEIIYSLDEK